MDDDDDVKIGNPDNIKFLNDLILGMGDADTSWLTFLLLNDKGIIKKIMDNYILILQNYPIFKGKIKYNTFACRITKTDKMLDMKPGAWTDSDTRSFRQWVNQNFKTDCSNELLNDAISRVAELNPYHPIQDWIKSLEWDNQPRLKDWLFDYMGVVAKDDKYISYISDVSTIMIGAAIKRVFEAGCKYDYVVLFEGSQGIGKSRAMQALAYNPDWFVSISIPDVTNKDIYMVIQGKWIVEFPEMHSFYRSENEAIKQFITTQIDTYRAPYGRHTQDYPRQCIFTATTNQYEHHDDETGYRRFLPVKVENAIDVDGLYKAVPQIYAEAYHYYKKGTFDRLFFEKKDSIEVAIQEQSAAMFDDIWNEDIKRYIEDRDEITIKELMINVLGFHDKKDQTKTIQMRISKNLRLLGYQKKVVRDGENIVKVWERHEK